MRFKIDENLPSSLSTLLEDNLLEFETVYTEELSGKPDEKVMEACRREGLVLITLDIGFANQKAYPAGSHPGVIVVRIKNQGVTSILSVMERFLAGKTDFDELSGCTMIVEEHRFRVRRGLRQA